MTEDTYSGVVDADREASRDPALEPAPDWRESYEPEPGCALCSFRSDDMAAIWAHIERSHPDALWVCFESDYPEVAS